MIIEACVENIEDAIKADSLGADQIEYCSHLEHGGLTPSLEEVKRLVEELSLGIKVMIRCQPGHFVVDKHLELQMLKEIEQFQKIGIHRMVLGVLTEENEVDMPCLHRIRQNFPTIELTFHKAIDECKDLIEAGTQLLEVNIVKEILSSGGQPTAQMGINTLNAMYQHLHPNIEIVAAGKITFENLDWHKENLTTQSFHGRRILF